MVGAVKRYIARSAGAHICPNRSVTDSSTMRLAQSSRKAALLVRVHGVVAFAYPNLALLLGGDVLDPNLLAVLLLEVANVPRVPQLGRHAQVLAATHQRVGLATLAGGGYAVVVAEKLALAAGLGDESGNAQRKTCKCQ